MLITTPRTARFTCPSPRSLSEASPLHDGGGDENDSGAANSASESPLHSVPSPGYDYVFDGLLGSTHPSPRSLSEASPLHNGGGDENGGGAANSASESPLHSVPSPEYGDVFDGVLGEGAREMCAEGDEGDEWEGGGDEWEGGGE